MECLEGALSTYHVGPTSGRVTTRKMDTRSAPKMVIRSALLVRRGYHATGILTRSAPAHALRVI
jgi:hypothetical protein